MISTARPLHVLFPLSAAVLFLGGCKPTPGVIGEQDNLSADPSGLMIPVPLGNRQEPAAHKIAICLSNATDPHQSVQINLLANLLREAGNYTLSFSDAKGSAKLQTEQLHSLMETKQKAVLVLPVDAAAAKNEITALRLAGTFVVGLDASLNDDSCDTVVFCDQKKIGMRAGEVIVNALKRKAQDSGAAEVTGRVVQIQGDENHPYCRARNEGFLAGLKAEPGIILVHDASANWNQANAGLQFKEALRLQKTFDAVYAHNDIMALGVSDAALEQQVRDSILIVGTDGIDGPGGGLEMLLKNEIDATVHQPLLTDFVWSIIDKMAKDPGFKPKASYEIEPVAFTPKNREELRAKGLTVPPL